MIKLSTVETRYQTDNKTYVKCILKTIIDDNINKKVLPPFVGIAKLHDGDKFDYNIGSKIALAKAERKAYKLVGKVIKEETEKLNNLLIDFEAFINKADNMVEHNSEYIKNIANNSKK